MDVERLERTVIIKKENPLVFFVKIILIVVIIFVGFTIIFPFAFTYYIHQSFTKYVVSDNFKDFDKIVVLGAGYDVVKYRVEKAAEIYELNPGKKVIMSGADIPTDNYYETEMMKNLAIQFGVSEADIEIDNNSNRTFDTCLDLKNNNLSYLLISQEYHLYRAIYLCREIGVNSYGIITDSNISKGFIDSLKTSDENSLYSLLREIYALNYSIFDLVKYRLF